MVRTLLGTDKLVVIVESVQDDVNAVVARANIQEAKRTELVQTLYRSYDRHLLYECPPHLKLYNWHITVVY